MRFFHAACWCVLLGMIVIGCSPTSNEQPMQLKNDFGIGNSPRMPKGEVDSIKSEINQNLDFTGLRGVLNGKWAKKGESDHHTVEFTDKSIEEKRYDWLHDIGKYEMKDDLIHIIDRDGRLNVYGLEFLSDSEIALRPEKVKGAYNFDDLAGRWQRISLPPGKEAIPLGTGPIAEAKKQVQLIEQKLAKNEGILKSVITDRDEYATKLRSLGVNTVAELKGNIRGQRLAENLAKIANDIDSLERRLAVIDTELLKAKSLVRILEQEQAGLSDTEKQNLLQQLREAERRTDVVSLPITPLDVDAAVEKALKAAPTTPKKKK